MARGLLEQEPKDVDHFVGYAASLDSGTEQEGTPLESFWFLRKSSQRLNLEMESTNRDPALFRTESGVSWWVHLAQSRTSFDGSRAPAILVVPSIYL